MTDNGKTWHASKRWFHHLKVSTGAHGITRGDETASVDKNTAENYTHQFEIMTQRNGFSPHQIFNSD